MALSITGNQLDIGRACVGDDSFTRKDEYHELCRIVGDAVFFMSAKGFETRKVAIADVLRTEMVRVRRCNHSRAELIVLAVKILEL